MDEAVTYFADGAVLLGACELVAFLVFTRGAKQLTTSQSLAMHWHLWNAIIIYTIMDGLNGGFADVFGVTPRIFHFYRTLDRRYHRDLAGTPHGPSVYEAAVAQTINACELCVYSWMSLLSAIGIAKRATWHRTLESAVLAMQAYGAILFMAPDMFDGCRNQQPHGEADCFPKVTPFTFFFVYFGVLINWIWLIVPVVMLAIRVARDVKAKAD